MADGSFRFQAGAGQHYFQQFNPQQTRHSQRASSPVSGARVPFNLDAPSPTRSPGAQSPPNQYNMFNQGHSGSQHAMMNGANRFGMQMNMSKPFQHQTHQHHGHQHQQHQDHGNHTSHSTNFSHHQHTHSGGPLSGTASQFNSTHATGSTQNSGYGQATKAPNEHWALQLQLVQQSREMTMQHPHARMASSSSKTTVASFTNGVTKEVDKEERNRAIMEDDSTPSDQTWTALDMGGQNLKVMHAALLNYGFLTKLYLNHNKITFIPPTIGKLRNLSVLDLSQNELSELPAEIGMLVNLREFFLFDNHLESLPYEMGTLYQLQILGVEGNPLDDEIRSIIVEQGTGALIKFMRENAQPPDPPNERDWVEVDDSPIPAEEKFTALSFNILCDKYATQSQHGYTSSQALSWEHRRALILDELRARDADIICLQEVDQDSYNEYFRPNLAHEYKSVFWPKTRAKTMAEKEAKLVDGCAIFYKHKKYICLDKQLIDFRNTAINRPDMKSEHDIFNRVMPRDDIAVAAFFENRQTGARLIVANVHIFWDPKYKDVKVVQAAILVEQLTKLGEKWANLGPTSEKDKMTYKYENGDQEEAQGDEQQQEEVQQEAVPSQEYPNVSALPLIVCGDFNSMPNSGVYDLIAHGSLSHLHEDLGNRRYGNFTRDGMTHPFSLKSSYSHVGELKFTNYTPTFVGVLDYIWYSTNALQVTGLLGDVDPDYLQRVPGFPNWHFPSDHLPLLVEFAVKSRKDKKVVEADFGPQREQRQQ